MLPAVHRLLTGHLPQVTSALRVAYNEAVGALPDQVTTASSPQSFLYLLHKNVLLYINMYTHIANTA